MSLLKILLFIPFCFFLFSLFAQNWSPEQNLNQQKATDFFHSKNLQASPEKPSSNGDSLQVHFPFEPLHLNPLTSNDPYVQQIQRLIGGTLLRKEDGKYLPLLCEKYDVEDLVILKAEGTSSYFSDKLFGKITQEEGAVRLKPFSSANPLYLSKRIAQGKILKVVRNAVYTLYLRDNITWHDGKPFTTKDIEFSFRKLKDRSIHCDTLRESYEGLKYCGVHNQKTIRFVFEEENPFALELLAHFPLLPQHIFSNAKLDTEKQNDILNRASPANLNFVGLGPYQIEKWEPRQSLTLKRFPAYFNKDTAYFEKIVFRFIANQEDALKAFEQKKLDFLPFLSPEKGLLWNAEDPEMVRGSVYSPGFSGIGWNLAHFAFQDQRVRLAMAHLFPRQHFMEDFLYGYAKPIGAPWTQDPLHSISYQPERARELLRLAGWKDRDKDGLLDSRGIAFEFEMTYPEGDPLAAHICETFASYLAKEGIRLKALPLSWSRFHLRVRKRLFDSFYWTQKHAPNPFIAWHSRLGSSKVQGLNYVGFQNKQADQIVEALSQELNGARQKVQLQALEHLLFQEQPYLFLWTAPSHFLYRKNLRGVRFSETFPEWGLQSWFRQQTH